MADQVKKPVGIMETVLRDAHQSLIATRMPTEIMLQEYQASDAFQRSEYLRIQTLRR